VVQLLCVTGVFEVIPFFFCYLFVTCYKHVLLLVTSHDYLLESPTAIMNTLLHKSKFILGCYADYKFIMSLHYRSQYLGVTLDRSLTYSLQLQSLRKSLTSRVALLRRLARHGWGAGETTLRTIYLALSIQPQSTALLSGAQCSHPPY